jgi:hypothetical protein
MVGKFTTASFAFKSTIVYLLWPQCPMDYWLQVLLEVVLGFSLSLLANNLSAIFAYLLQK